MLVCVCCVRRVSCFGLFVNVYIIGENVTASIAVAIAAAAVLMLLLMLLSFAGNIIVNRDERNLFNFISILYVLCLL